MAGRGIGSVEDSGQVDAKRIKEKREKVCTPECPETYPDLSTERELIKCYPRPCQA